MVMRKYMQRKTSKLWYNTVSECLIYFIYYYVYKWENADREAEYTAVLPEERCQFIVKSLAALLFRAPRRPPQCDYDLFTRVFIFNNTSDFTKANAFRHNLPSPFLGTWTGHTLALYYENFCSDCIRSLERENKCSSRCGTAVTRSSLACLLRFVFSRHFEPHTQCEAEYFQHFGTRGRFHCSSLSSSGQTASGAASRSAQCRQVRPLTQNWIIISHAEVTFTDWLIKRSQQWEEVQRFSSSKNSPRITFLALSFWKVKPMWKCLKLVFSLLTIRETKEAQKEVWSYKSLWEDFSLVLLPHWTSHRWVHGLTL